MAKQTIAVGKRYGRLTILELGERQGTVYLDKTLCECGTIKTVRRADLQAGSVSSCGCLRRENSSRMGLATRKHHGDDRIRTSNRIAVGKRYGRLTILSLGNRKNGYIDLALCDCGTTKEVRRSDLQTRATTSCGCARRENAAKMGAATIKHGHSRHPLYYVWHTMIARCSNPDMPAYRYYGARGIRVCDRWRNSFDAFLEDMGPRPVGLQLDRIDNDGDYEPGNVRWANVHMQLANRRRYGSLNP